jgi:signal transduction histidine kinase
MQALVKSPARIGKFVPHSTEAGVDRKPAETGRPLPVLRPEAFDQLAHDARNVLSALKLYCDLLAEPGILTAAHGHYAEELQAVTDTAARLVERLAAPRRKGLGRAGSQPNAPANPEPGDGVDDPGGELLSLRPLLAAIAGPQVELEIEAMPCGGRTRLSKEDLMRVLLNLARNASEAMPEGGKLRITAQYADGLSFLDAAQISGIRPRSVVITVEDSGPGIPEKPRERVFEAGFTTPGMERSRPGAQRRGLGLSIVRSLIEAAGGTARVSSSGRGTRFELEVPITSGMYENTDTCGLVADSAPKACIECR